MNGVATRALFRSLLRAVRHAAQESCSIEAAVRSGVVRHDAASRAAIRLQHQARTGALAGDVRAAFRADNHGLDDGFEALRDLSRLRAGTANLRESGAFGPMPPRPPSVFFCVGQPLEHEQWGHCLVYGWEARCGAIPLGSMPEGIVDNRLYFAGIDSGVSREQPFYRVLLADGTARFVAQERLRAVGRRAGLQHPVRGSSFFFVSADASAGRYLANTHLASRFPEDFELGLSA